MALTITEVLNIWNESGVFSYVLPFLLIFAVTFALLQKSGIFSKNGNDNRPLLAIVAASIGLLALQMDFVSSFFAMVFPRFGIGLSILLVVFIFLGFFTGNDEKKFRWVGITLGVAVAIWALISWDDWFGGGWPYGGNFFYSEDFWSLVILAGIIWIIYLVARPGKPSGDNSANQGRSGRNS